MALVRLFACLLAAFAACFAVVAAPAAADHRPVVEENDWEDELPAEEAPVEEAVPAEFDIPTVPVEELPGVVPDPVAPAPAPAAPGPVPAGGDRTPNVPYGALIASTARRFRVPVALFTALVRQESGFNARAKSPVGARGLTQLMPATARGLGVKKPYDPAQNLSGGARYLRAQLTRFGSKRLALAAYNAGPGAVSRYRGVPPYAETRNYVKRILGYEAQLRRAGIR